MTNGFIKFPDDFLFNNTMQFKLELQCEIYLILQVGLTHVYVSAMFGLINSKEL